MEPPIGFVPLCTAADLVGHRVVGAKWSPLGTISSETIAGRLDPQIDSVLRQLAEQCEAGKITSAYRSITGAENLDCSVWHSPAWRNYFAMGAIDLDLPLLDQHGRPNPDGFTARCRRDVFLRRDHLEHFLSTLPRPPLLIRDKLRYPTDEPLIQEALGALMDGRATGPLQAAKLVQSKAHDGPSQTSLDRLRKLIAAERDAQSSPIIAKTSPTP
jgi:hypothetical protein